jgi:hypothetical protein
MLKRKDISLRLLVSLVILVGLLVLPVPAFSQQTPNLQNLIVNGNFAEGFQPLGIAYNWGAFNNGQAAVGWNVDTWDKVVPAGQKGVQLIEIKNSLERDRFAGIYQTVTVVPEQQYKLTIKGLIRSTEGDIKASDYGYRLQYGVDDSDGTAWELISPKDWRELPWDEQPMTIGLGETYRMETFEATLTAKSDRLTLFIRGWKKWMSNGSGIFDIQEVTLVGPAPASFTAPAAGNNPQAASEFAAPAAGEQKSTEPQSQPAPAQTETKTQLPVSGQGRDNSIDYIVIVGVTLLLTLLIGAIAAIVRQRKPAE